MLNQAMLMLAKAGAVFVGQSVAFPGTAMYADLDGVPAEQRVEFPVAEELNVGYATGLSLMGFLPVMIIPRMDFLLRAMDQLVNHLDKLEEMSRGQFKPKVIIRTRVGARKPLDAGPQHSGDYTGAFQKMLTNILVCKITDAEMILPTYRAALSCPHSVMVVEAL